MIKLLFIIFFNSAIFANALTTAIGSGSQLNKVSKLKSALTISDIALKDLALLSKAENIQHIMNLAIKENRVEFEKQFKYMEQFTNLKDGDKILLKCLKSSGCDLGNYAQVMQQSSLHRILVFKNPHMNLVNVNHTVGSINENIMHKYFKSTGWTKIEGEVGRNGIDGLFIKRNKNGDVIDMLVVESKYNKSGLQHTNHGKQMSNQWVLKKLTDLEKQYPNNKDYKTLKQLAENEQYRSLLWNLKVQDNKLAISLQKIHDNSGKVTKSNLIGRGKMKINYNGNQIIDLNNPKSNFHKKVSSWYKEEIQALGSGNKPKTLHPNN